VRFKNPMNDMVIFEDLVKGKISIANKELDDLIVARSEPLGHHVTNPSAPNN
jgi:glutamyl-tRNA synthetase